MPKTLYTTAEAANELGVTPGRVRQMVLNKELKAEKLGRDLLIPATAVENAKNRKTTPGPPTKKPSRK